MSNRYLVKVNTCKATHWRKFPTLADAFYFIHTNKTTRVWYKLQTATYSLIREGKE